MDLVAEIRRQRAFLYGVLTNPGNSHYKCKCGLCYETKGKVYGFDAVLKMLGEPTGEIKWP